MPMGELKEFRGDTRSYVMVPASESEDLKVSIDICSSEVRPA